jgi:WD40 repeat protein
MSHLVFWPLRKVYPVAVDGCTAGYTGVTFSPDGRWVAANWTDDTVRLWPLPGSSEAQPRTLGLPKGRLWTVPVFDPRLRHLLLLGLRGSVRGVIVPLDGAKSRELESLPERTLTSSRPAISPSGRLTATAVFWGPGPKILRVWDLETGGRRDFTLPVPHGTSADEDRPPSELTGYEGGVSSLGFVDERTLLTSGDGGIRRWNLATGADELLVAAEPGHTMTMALSADGRTALTFEQPLGPIEQGGRCGRVALVDLAVPVSRPLPGFGECGVSVALDPSGAVAATADREGVVRVGRVSGGEPHLLLGHERLIKGVAVSSDRRWVATVGEDKTLRLWPMPDLSKPPLHVLPLDALLAKLRSLTNVRAVRDPTSSAGWRIEIGPFPGWKDVPAW